MLLLKLMFVLTAHWSHVGHVGAIIVCFDE